MPDKPTVSRLRGAVGKRLFDPDQFEGFIGFRRKGQDADQETEQGSSPNQEGENTDGVER